VERRKILEENMSEIPGRIMLSDQKVAKNQKELRGMIMAAIKEGLEGLVLKDSQVLNFKVCEFHFSLESISDLRFVYFRVSTSLASVTGSR